MIWKSIKLFVETNVTAIYLFQPFSHLTKPVDAYFSFKLNSMIFKKSNLLTGVKTYEQCGATSEPSFPSWPRQRGTRPVLEGFFSEILISMFSPRRGTCERLLWLLASQMTQPFILHHLYLFKYTHICIGHFAAISPDNSSKDFTWCCEWGGRRPRMIVSSEELTPCWRQLSNTWNYDPGSQCTSGDGLLTVWYQINYLVLGSITKCVLILNPLRNGLNIT